MEEPLEIILEPFDIEDKERCSYVIARLLPLFEQYYQEIKTDPVPFDFCFVEFVKDWWHGEKVLVVAYRGDHAVGFIYAKSGTNLFTSQPEMRIKHIYAVDFTSNDAPTRDNISTYLQTSNDNTIMYQMIAYLKQVLPLYKSGKITI